MSNSPPSLGIWRVNTPESDVVCVSHETPLKDFARFTGALICDQTTWNAMTRVVMGELQAEEEPVVNLGQMLLLEHPFPYGIPARKNINAQTPQCTRFSSRTLSNPCIDHGMGGDQKESLNGIPTPAGFFNTPPGSSLSLPDHLSSEEPTINTLATPPLTQPASSSQSSIKSDVPMPSLSPIQPMIQLQPLRTLSFTSTSDPAGLEKAQLAASTLLKAQENCRFAVGALDVEDLARAREQIHLALDALRD